MPRSGLGLAARHEHPSSAIRVSRRSPARWLASDRVRTALKEQTLSFSRKRIRAISALGALTMAGALAGPALSAPAQAATTQYNLTIFRDPAQAQNTAFFGINANGDIVGIADETGAETQEAFLLKAGSTTMQFLGSPGDPGNAHSAARPAGINAADDIAGSSPSSTNGATAAPRPAWRACPRSAPSATRWRPGSTTAT